MNRVLQSPAARVLLGVWALMIVAGVATFMAGHWTLLPQPSADDTALPEQLLALAPDQGGTNTVAVHVLDVDCRCSARVAEHLVDSKRNTEVAEWALVTCDEGGARPAWLSQLEQRGFRTFEMTSEALSSRFGLESAPMLLVLNRPEARFLYTGGYSPRQQSLDIRDLEIISRARDGSTVIPSLPVFGCGVSPGLQASLDPLGIKY